jgi:hypothetical protein
MIVAHPPPAMAAPATGLRIPVERLRCLLLWLTGASSSIVLIEPSPYEVVSFLTLAVFVLGGLSLSPALLPLAVLLAVINIGYSISASAVINEAGVITWILTSWYLALSAVFFSAMLGSNTQARLDALVRGCVVAAVITSLVAIVGYSRIFPAANETLLLYERARATFKDPNVLGAFLVFPTLIALQRVIVGNLVQAAKAAMLAALLAAALLLSFSRAAWGQTVFTAGLMLALMFVTSRSPKLRLRIVLLSVAGVVAVALFIVALLSIDAVAVLFKERASLQQDYDVGAQGRFARHFLGAIFALDIPLGIGPLQFSKYFPEDPHNSYLNAFMAGGWLSGVCYPALVAISLLFGLRAVFVPTPWQQTTIAVYAGFVGIAFESFIIDSDHWRHTFLLVGVLWGLIAASRRYAAQARRAAAAGPALVEGAALARQQGPAYTFSRRSVAQPG